MLESAKGYKNATFLLINYLLNYLFKIYNFCLLLLPIYFLHDKLSWMYTFILVRFEIRVDRESKIYYFHLHPFKHPPKSSSGYSRFIRRTVPPPLSRNHSDSSRCELLYSNENYYIKVSHKFL